MAHATLARTKLPPALAQRLETLRVDEGLRADLEARVAADIRKRHRRSCRKEVLAIAAAPAAAPGEAAAELAPQPPSPASKKRTDDDNDTDDDGGNALPQIGSVSRPFRDLDEAQQGSAAVRRQAKGRQRRRNKGEQSGASVDSTLVPHPAPPLPESEWAADLVERARGDRARDPLELGNSSSVRRREKAKELGGAFHYGLTGSEAERLSAATSRSAPSDSASALDQDAARRWMSTEGAARRVGPELDFGRVDDSSASDGALFSDMRTPFVDAAKQEQRAYRQRNRNAELSPRRQRLPPVPIPAHEHPKLRALAKLGAASSPGAASSLMPASVRRTPIFKHGRVMDDAEVTAARLLLSTRLTIYRKA